MMSQILQLLRQVFQQCFGWFTRTLNAVGGSQLWFSAILASVVYRFIFAPVFGHASSDVAKKSYNAFRRRKGV